MVLKSTNKTSKEPQTMAELLAKSGTKVKGLAVGEKVKGIIVAKTNKAVIIDIGGKCEGIVAERAFAEAKDFIKRLKVGDEVNASVLVSETKEGGPILSLRQAAGDASWEKLERIKKSKEPVAVYGKSVSPSGIMIEVEGLIGFIPTSRLGKSVSANPQELVGKYFKAEVIEIDRSSNKIVLSEKAVSEAADLKEIEKALAKVKEGEVYDGEVTTIANFGCFVKIILGKKTSVEGLVHISEISWGKVEHVSDQIKVGDKLKVRVIGIKDGRLSLSIKKALEDPWDKAEKKYKVDTKLKGKVVRISDFGTFVEVEPGIEGLIHLTQIPPGVRLVVGGQVDCYVQDIDTKTRKLSLGLVLTSKPIGYK